MRLDAPAKLMRKQLHAIADAQNRQSALQDRLIDRRRALDRRRYWGHRRESRLSRQAPEHRPASRWREAARSRRATHAHAGRSAGYTANHSLEWRWPRAAHRPVTARESLPSSDLASGLSSKRGSYAICALRLIIGDAAAQGKLRGLHWRTRPFGSVCRLKRHYFCAHRIPADAHADGAILYSGVLYKDFTGVHPVATWRDLSSGATTAISIRKVKRGDANV